MNSEPLLLGRCPHHVRRSLRSPARCKIGAPAPMAMRSMLPESRRNAQRQRPPPVGTNVGWFRALLYILRCVAAAAFRGPAVQDDD